MICQVCGEKAKPEHISKLPVVIEDIPVLKRVILCGECKSVIENLKSTGYHSFARAVTGLFRVRGVKVQDLEDYEGYMK